MKLSQSFFYTLRENAKDEDSISSNLLVRAGMIKKSSNGIYMIMPMGKKVLSKIENIIREEMDAKGCTRIIDAGFDSGRCLCSIRSDEKRLDPNMFSIE